MDQQSNRKRKGLGGKGRLVIMSFYSRPPPAAAASNNDTHTTHRLPKPSTTNRVTHNTGTPAKQRAGGVEFVLNQEQVIPQQPKQMSVPVVLPDNSSSSGNGGSSTRGYAVDYGGVVVDESVDIKAATYISNVRERIRLQVQTVINS